MLKYTVEGVPSRGIIEIQMILIGRRYANLSYASWPQRKEFMQLRKNPLQRTVTLRYLRNKKAF